VPSNSLSWRIGYWERLVPEAAVNPVTGLGFDAVEHTEPEQLQPHNVFVQAYVETGVIGLGAVLAIIWTIAKMLRDRLRHAARGWPRLLALGATSVAIAMLLECPGENLLSSTLVYWYLAVAMTYGIRFSPLDAEHVVFERERVGANP
jgi:O-antigen ligase